MVLRPISREAAASISEPIGAWAAVEQRQRARADAWWIIPQPAHSALAGEIAARLRPELFSLPAGAFDAKIARAIALHDSGWGQPDAQQIQRLRASGNREKPVSFLDSAGPEAIAAWTSSADIAERVAPLGGYLVSRHFWRIAGRAHELGGSPQDFERFRSAEEKRQQRLLPGSGRSAEDLERLTDALQFADLLSLFVCSGVSRPATISIQNSRVQIVPEGEQYQVNPSPFLGEESFDFAALRHPLAKGEPSGQSFRVNFPDAKHSRNTTGET